MFHIVNELYRRLRGRTANKCEGKGFFLGRTYECVLPMRELRVREGRAYAGEAGSEEGESSIRE